MLNALWGMQRVPCEAAMSKGLAMTMHRVAMSCLQDGAQLGLMPYTTFAILTWMQCILLGHVMQSYCQAPRTMLIWMISSQTAAVPGTIQSRQHAIRWCDTMLAPLRVPLLACQCTFHAVMLSHAQRRRIAHAEQQA
jgi:hypothetical protein